MEVFIKDPNAEVVINVDNVKLRLDTQRHEVSDHQQPGTSAVKLATFNLRKERFNRQLVESESEESYYDTWDGYFMMYIFLYLFVLITSSVYLKLSFLLFTFIFVGLAIVYVSVINQK